MARQNGKSFMNGGLGNLCCRF